MSLEPTFSWTAGDLSAACLFWRSFAVLAVVAAVLVALRGVQRAHFRGAHIARVIVVGIITETASSTRG